jgi:hypothetical protein
LNEGKIIKSKFNLNFPVIIGEVGILNDYIKQDNSIEQFLYTLFSMSYEYDGILPCLWDIPIASMTNLVDKNYYLNKNNNEWSNDKYDIIFNKFAKGKFLKSIDYYNITNLETEDGSYFGYFIIYLGTKRITKIFVNVRFFVHIEDNIVLTVYSSDKDYSFLFFDFEEKDGKKQYDGTSIFTIDGSELDLHFFVQAAAWFNENYMIINNITVQYEEAYLKFDHYSYKSDILNEINY